MLAGLCTAMTISELQIQLDISLRNELEVLKQYAYYKTRYGYLFVDSSDGQCYLFSMSGKLNDIRKVKSIGDYAFGSCTSLSSIIIPSSVKCIGDSAFCSCTSLESITIPDSVKNIRDYAFYHCTSLKSIITPDSVKSIGKRAFYSCTALNEVIFKRKTIGQVKAMANYPWGIKNRSIIKCR